MRFVEADRNASPAPDPLVGNRPSRPAADPFHGVVFAGKKESPFAALLTTREPRVPLAFLLRHRTDAPRHHHDPAASPPPGQVAFVDRTLRKAGLNPRLYRQAPLLRRIPACLRALKVDSIADATDEIAASQSRLLIAVNSLLIGTTSFFRDRSVFDDLRHHLLPSLLEREDRPRIWSAACSDGAELYSMAMLLEHLGAKAPVLHGTDCRASAIARAKEGVYPQSAISEMPSAFVRTYLERKGTSVTVKPSLRERVTWETADLLTRPARSRWDLILCRNLAIYLEPEPMARLWQKLSAALLPGGYLVVGRAEKPPIRGFAPVAPCLYRKDPDSAP